MVVGVSVVVYECVVGDIVAKTSDSLSSSLMSDAMTSQTIF